MSGLRFAFLTTFYPPFNFGGDGIGIQRFARGLARRGHRVTVVHDADAYAALRRGPLPLPEPVPEIDGVEVVSLQSGLGLLSPLLTQQLGRPVANGRRIRRLLDEGGFDVINYHNTSLIGGPGLFKYGRAIKLYMAHEHWLVCPTHVLWRHRRELCTGRECLRCQLRYRRPPQLWRWTGYLEREARHVDAFIAMSEFSRQKHREFGFPFEMEVVPYFLEEDGGSVASETGKIPGQRGRIVASEKAEDQGRADGMMRGGPHPRPYFLFVGRLEKIKGLDDVIPLFRGPGPADLLIAGDGEYGAELRRRAAVVGADRVRFLGRVGLEELSRYYRHALALIVPSVCFETFGIIIIEAFRQGTPVLARRIGPFPELLARGGGETFDTAGELAAGMARLEREPGLRDRLGAEGKAAFAANWSERVVVPQYLEVVRRAAERKGDQAVLARLAAGSRVEPAAARRPITQGSSS
jgi:glycosyltransferase involved in cell wall biosynthesis